MLRAEYVQAEVEVTVYKGSGNLAAAKTVLCGCAGRGRRGQVVSDKGKQHEYIYSIYRGSGSG